MNKTGVYYVKDPNIQQRNKNIKTMRNNFCKNQTDKTFQLDKIKKNKETDLEGKIITIRKN